MFAYDPSEWTDFFVAAAGASAALAGLVFVAVSINVDRILKYAGLPERGLETVLLLMTVLLVSLFGLVPGQSPRALGVELFVLAGCVGGAVLRLPTIRSDDKGGTFAWQLARWGVRGAALIPFLVGALSLVAESGGGLYWIVAGMIFATTGAVTNAWVLLVEILR